MSTEPLRLAAATLRDQSYDTTPIVPIGVAAALADWLDSVALSWETAARHDADILPYLTGASNHPMRIAGAVNALLHGEDFDR